jgi:hypothetical protein
LHARHSSFASASVGGDAAGDLLILVSAGEADMAGGGVAGGVFATVLFFE